MEAESVVAEERIADPQDEKSSGLRGRPALSGSQSRDHDLLEPNIEEV
jgi:hypothetical protein